MLRGITIIWLVNRLIVKRLNFGGSFLKNLYQDTVHKLCRVSLLHRYRISTALSGLRVYRGQPEILEYLIKCGDCSQREIAEEMGVSPASIATSIKRMKKAGFVEQAIDPDDRRINRIRITEEGKRIYNIGKSECNKTDMLVFNGFTEEEIGQFSRMLSRIINNLSLSGVSEKDVIEYIRKDNINRNGDDKNAFNPD